MHLFIIDRFEADTAYLQDETGTESLRVPRGELPPGAKEGDVLMHGTQGYLLDEAATARRREKMRARLLRVTKGNNDNI